MLICGVEDEAPVSYGRFSLHDDSGLGGAAEEEVEPARCNALPGTWSFAGQCDPNAVQERQARNFDHMALHLLKESRYSRGKELNVRSHTLYVIKFTYCHVCDY
jgi:hypothetical protein